MSSKAFCLGCELSTIFFVVCPFLHVLVNRNLFLFKTAEIVTERKLKPANKKTIRNNDIEPKKEKNKDTDNDNVKDRDAKAKAFAMTSQGAIHIHNI